MPTLVELTTAALDAFNDAKKPTIGNYNNLLQYLCPQHVIIHRVDDITPIIGTAAQIVDNFNHYQIGQWPQFIYDKSSYTVSGRVVWVRGAYYNTAAGGKTNVTCGYHFDPYDKIDVAYASPLP